MKTEEYKSVKTRISKYYKDKKALNLQYQRLKSLEAKFKNIMVEMEGPIFKASLNADIMAISYDSVSVTGGLPVSPMDREIENIYKSYEKEKIKILNEIYLTKKLIYQLETDTEKFDCYIGMLSDEARLILEMIFKKDMSITAVGLKLDISKSSVSRKVLMIAKDILLLDTNYSI